MKPPTQTLNTEKYRIHSDILCANFEQRLGYPLLESGSDIYDLFNAPFAILSHDNSSDPLFSFANAKALQLFGYSWDELIGTPSKASALSIKQAEREKLFKEVEDKGFILDYAGTRISATGQPFFIKDAIIWQLFDKDEGYYGQAAMFPTPN